MTADNLDLRNTVLNMLKETLEEGVFSHIVSGKVFSKDGICAGSRERAFMSRLYLGTLERLIYLDYCINRVSNTHTSRMKPVILNILRISTYQLMFMDSVPDRAVLSEAARLTRKRGFDKLVPFVNAVLRSIQRDGRRCAEEEMPENVRFSVPKWIYELISDQYGKGPAQAFFEESINQKHSVTIRLNTLKAAEDTLIKAMEAEGCHLKKRDEDLCYELQGFESLTGLDAFEKGLFSVQDTSSVKAALSGCRELKKAGNDSAPLIIDVCAAPGGKSICAAQEFPLGTVISRDISASKTALIEENIKRLGLANIRPQVFDATKYDESMTGMADMVIADLPCSGIGVIGKKPDIKFRLRQKDLAELAKLQRDILANVCRYVKKGGILVYSTCTVNREENDENVRFITDNHPYVLLSQEQILEGGDGFFIAVLKRQSE